MLKFMGKKIISFLPSKYLFIKMYAYIVLAYHFPAIQGVISVITVFKIFIWGGISSDIRLEI